MKKLIGLLVAIFLLTQFGCMSADQRRMKRLQKEKLKHPERYQRINIKGK